MGNEQKTKKFGTDKIIIAVFALICALFLWVYVTDLQGEPYERTFAGVQVVFEGEATLRETRGYVITDVSNTTISVKIEGDRRTVLSLDSSDLTAVVVVSGYSTGTHSPSYSISYPNNIKSSSLTITSKIPELITFTVEKVDTRVYDVRGIFSGNPASGYGAEPLEFSPNTVRVTGPASDLDLIDCAWVEVTRGDVDRTLTFESNYLLIDAEGNPVDTSNLEFELPTVTVTLPIISIKEVALTIDVIDGGGATEEKNVDYSIEPQTITISGDPELLDGLNSISIATIDLANLKDTSLTGQYSIVIPNGTKIVSGPKEATLTLELKGLESKTITVTNFSTKNVTNGYVGDVETEELEIIIRGSASVLQGIAANNIRAVADLSEFGETEGLVSAPVKINIDGTTQAGAVGQYTIFVNITKAGG